MASDLTLQPDFVLTEDIKFQTLVSSFENGVEQRRQKWSTPLRSFTLKYTNRIGDEMEVIKDLFTTKCGQANTFTWTNPNDDVEYVVRFNDDSFQYDLKAFNVYDFEAKITQVK